MRRPQKGPLHRMEGGTKGASGPDWAPLRPAGRPLALCATVAWGGLLLQGLMRGGAPRGHRCVWGGVKGLSIFLHSPPVLRRSRLRDPSSGVWSPLRGQFGGGPEGGPPSAGKPPLAPSPSSWPRPGSSLPPGGPSTHLSINQSTYQSIYQSINLSIYLPIIYQPINLSINLSTYLSTYQPIYLSINPSINLSIYQSIYLPSIYHLSSLLHSRPAGKGGVAPALPLPIAGRGGACTFAEGRRCRHHFWSQPLPIPGLRGGGGLGVPLQQPRSPLAGGERWRLLGLDYTHTRFRKIHATLWRERVYLQVFTGG